MPRVKRGTSANKKRARVLKKTKGFMWGRKSKERAAKEALLHAQSHAFKGRKEKKRVFRRLWQTRLNAALRTRGTNYSTFIAKTKEKSVILDRKILSNIAKDDPKAFNAIYETVMK